MLEYRVPSAAKRAENLPPLLDAQRAMSVVRANAERWGLDPKRIGILGFSAGGPLATQTSTHFDERHYDRLDAVDAINCRPDFTALVYPAYLAKDGTLGDEIRVTKETPPTFLVHAYDNPIKPENGVVLFTALQQAGVPADLHVYGSRGHGFGLRPSEHPCSTWLKRCEEWLRSRGILTKAGE